MANRFWNRWRAEYLQTLQPRRKWQEEQRNIQVNDLVLLRDAQAARNTWTMAIITAVFPGQDGKVRKVELKVTIDGTVKNFFRPVTEMSCCWERKTNVSFSLIHVDMTSFTDARRGVFCPWQAL